MDDYQVQSIALKTLKQRCEYLQERLHAVEEENCKLKLEKAQDSNRKTSKDPNGLEQQIIILNEEKSQMAHQIQMISTENLNLWSQLSEILPRNDISGIRFSIAAAPDQQLQKFRQFNKNSKDLCDYEKESLEEISLKLINGIIKGKNELENQYSQMIDLQKDVPEGKTSSFISKQLDNRASVKNLRNYVQKLKDFRQALFEQRNELSNTILLLKTSKAFSTQTLNASEGGASDGEHKNYTMKNDISNQSSSAFSTLEGSGKTKSENEKLDHTGICPMCGETFPGAFEDLYRHVSEHFNDENDEFVDASSAFEFIK